MIPEDALCPVCQRYELKAIHNTDRDIISDVRVVSGMSKIRTESNSQLSFVK
mgnify:CR=1 FL=1